jgi:hypothetical protein
VKETVVTSEEQEGIDRTIGEFPPKEDVLLVGWVVMAEWMEPGGDRFISRLLADGSTPWQAKGYLYEGLNGVWPFNPEHHNPGHPSGWMRVEREQD